MPDDALRPARTRKSARRKPAVTKASAAALAAFAEPAAPILSLSRRTRRTPFTARVEAAGVRGYTVYNRMLLPTVFESVEADYRHLKTDVQVWDVSCERQIEMRGPDCAKLAQMLTPRDLRRIQIGQCLYAPVVDEAGGMLNDPVMLKLAEDRWWVSIADSDLLLWMKGLALGYRLDVDVFEAETAPLAVQGPKADDLAARVFGDGVREIPFFRWRQFDFDGVPFCVARSGYSKQGGFEIYVEETRLAERLWDALFEAGADLNVRPGGPNLIERIESGLLSYGNDMTRSDTPYDCGLDAFCTPQTAFGCVGRAALMRVAESGPRRRIRGLAISGDRTPACREPWPILSDGAPIGQITSAAWSPDFGFTVAIGMVASERWEPGTMVTAATPDGLRDAEVRTLPF